VLPVWRHAPLAGHVPPESLSCVLPARPSAAGGCTVRVWVHCAGLGARLSHADAGAAAAAAAAHRTARTGQRPHAGVRPVPAVLAAAIPHAYAHRRHRMTGCAPVLTAHAGVREEDQRCPQLWRVYRTRAAAPTTVFAACYACGAAGHFGDVRATHAVVRAGQGPAADGDKAGMQDCPTQPPHARATTAFTAAQVGRTGARLAPPPASGRRGTLHVPVSSSSSSAAAAAAGRTHVHYSDDDSDSDDRAAAPRRHGSPFRPYYSSEDDDDDDGRSTTGSASG
jgi:hypothetical protein